MSDEINKRTAEGYIACLPYAGDGWYLTDHPIPPKDIKDIDWGEPERSGMNIVDLFSDLEGKEVKVTVEVL